MRPEGGVLRAWWLAVDAAGRPDALGSSWRVAAVGVFGVRYRAGPYSTVSRSIPA